MDAAKQSKMRSQAIMAHIAQIVVAIVIMGLAAYGVDYIKYDVLIYSVSVCACSLLVSSWLIATKTVFAKYTNKWVSVGLHAWMNIFWIINLGLTASLAREWNPQCSYDEKSDQICSKYVTKRDTTFKVYFGALIASASLIGIQVLLWLGTTALLAMDLKQRRSTVSQAPDAEAPRFSADSEATEGDPEKNANLFDNVSSVPVRDHASPVLPPASPDIEGEQIEPYRPLTERSLSTQ
ncbi:hypothetical protein E8E13_003918 [Curvularia kusanoi]|uniref:MARVEL domain-containing protein n=1 Tax=Curvularia kusanoi TaxID=90978 RepID=A0A9P4T7S2_CURKU|nr:hypothetical protein E8E13_003918 [Curvularia kusanoi]